MALEVGWMLTAFIILATVCIGVFKRIVGDDLQFRRGPRDFLLDRLARYGDPFTFSMMGKTHTVINSPEAIKFVLSTAHASFGGGYSVHFHRLLSEGKFWDVKWHSHFRKIVITTASGDGLQKLVPFISSLAEKTVKSWENQAVVNSVEELHNYAFNVGMHLLWRNLEPGSEEMVRIRTEVFCLTRALEAKSLNYPGSSFHKALKARQVLVSSIQSEISRRRKAGFQQDDVLNALMSITEVEVADYDICSIIVSLMFSSFSTSAVLMPWVLKYLDIFPEVRQRVQEEQDCLWQTMTEDKSLTWFKPKNSMPYTLQVIYEIMRIERQIIMLPRQANKNVDYNGLVFPKGSSVWASTTSIHSDPKYYPDPWKFNPSRFDEKPNPSTFLPFGQGPHLCPGSELALTMAMFMIHHLITNYSWERCGHDKAMTKVPFGKLLGYPIRLVKR